MSEDRRIFALYERKHFHYMSEHRPQVVDYPRGEFSVYARTYKVVFG